MTSDEASFPGEGSPSPAPVLPGSVPEAATTVPPAAGPPPPARLVRTRDRVVAGVCGGLARYLGVDPVLLRVAAVVVAFLTGFAPVIVGYVVAWIVVPEEDAAGGRPVARSPGSPDGARNVLGIVLIVAGGVVLLQRVSPWWFRGDLLLPLILVAIGVAVVAQGVRR